MLDSWPEKSAFIVKRQHYFWHICLGNISSNSGHRSCAPEVVRCVSKDGSLTLHKSFLHIIGFEGNKGLGEQLRLSIMSRQEKQ